MGFADKLKNAAKSAGFYEETSKQNVSNSTPSNSVPVNSIPAPTPAMYVVPVPPVASVTAGIPTAPVLADADMVNGISGQVEASTVRGYPEFKVVLDTMSALPDAQRYPMALNVVAASQKYTPDVIVASLDDRISILDNLDSQFQSDYEKSIDEQVNQKRANAEQLAQKIAELEQQRVQLVNDAGASQINLDRERATYAASSNVVRTALTNERQRIAAYLPPTVSTK